MAGFNPLVRKNRPGALRWEAFPGGLSVNPERDLSSERMVLPLAKKGCLLPVSSNMVMVMNAIETTGIVDAQHQLRLDEPLPIAGQSRVRVIVLVPEADDIPEAAWTNAASANPAFDFLKDAAEDIYTAADGRPFHDEG
jgi:hypothetical protein